VFNNSSASQFSVAFEMNSQPLTTLRRAKRTCKLSFLRLVGRQFCPACGFRGHFLSRKALGPDLVAEWELSPQWENWFNLREGRCCPKCWSNLRSGHLARGLLRALRPVLGRAVDTVDAAFEDPRIQALQIAEINSAGSLHPFLAKSPNLRYSEYGSTDPNVPSEDLMNLSYADSTFDLVLTSETLEHVPDVDRALREIHRILKPQGLHVFTVPVHADRKVTRRRAHLQNGELVHTLPASYHGSAGSRNSDFLVFYEFGTDFPDRCRAAGFVVETLRDEKNPALVVFSARKS
jgi:SAM-dependent methyltransferase